MLHLYSSDRRASLCNSRLPTEFWRMYTSSLLNTSWFNYILRSRSWRTFSKIYTCCQSWRPWLKEETHLWDKQHLDCGSQCKSILFVLLGYENNVSIPIRMLLFSDEIRVYELPNFWFDCFYNLETELLLLLLDWPYIRIDVEAIIAIWESSLGMSS